MKNPKIIIVFFILILLIIAVFSIITYTYNQQAKLSSSLLIHTNKVLYKSERVLSLLKDIETGTRGFLITGDSTFLQPYNQSKDRIQTSIKELKLLTADEPGQQVTMDSLALLAGERLVICEHLQFFRKSEHYELQGIKALLIHGKNVMDNIRNIISSLQQQENKILAEREISNRNNSKNTETGMFILFGSILFLLIALFFSAQYFSRLRKTDSSTLTQLNSKLIFFTKQMDDIVKGISDPFFALDKKFYFIFLNPAVKNSIGLGKGEIMGKNFFEIFPQYNATTIGPKITEVMQTRQSATFEMYEDFLDQWMDVSIYPTAEGVSVTLKDASKRKDYEKEIKRANEFLEETNQVANIGGWEVDLIKGMVTWTSVTRFIHETTTDYIPDLKSGLLFYKEGNSRDQIIHLVNDAIENGTNWDAELQIVTAQGNEKWIRTKGKAEFENNECVRIIGTFQDIDTQKKMADLLLESEDRFKSAFDNSPNGMALVNADKTIIAVNNALCEITGYSKEYLLSVTIEKITHPDDTGKDAKAYNEMLGSGVNRWQYEKRYIHKDGHTVWINASGSVIKSSNGEIKNFVAQMQDITKSKMEQQQLNDEKKILKTLIDHLPLNVYMKDIHLKKTLVNKRELLFSGAKREDEVLGKTDYDLYPAATAMAAEKEDKELLATGKPILNKETTSTKKDGTETVFLTSKIPFVNDQGKISGIIGISYDITWKEKKQSPRSYEE